MPSSSEGVSDDPPMLRVRGHAQAPRTGRRSVFFRVLDLILVFDTDRGDGIEREAQQNHVFAVQKHVAEGRVISRQRGRGCNPGDRERPADRDRIAFDREGAGDGLVGLVDIGPRIAERRVQEAEFVSIAVVIHDGDGDNASHT